MLIRPAHTADAPAIASIYSHYVRETFITFACEEPSAAHYAAQIDEGKYPFLVAEEDGAVVGFAYAAAFRQKEAYRWDVELTIYVRPGLERQGIGSRLMRPLLEILRRQGFLMAYSCITLPNERSIGLHKRFGFEELGVFPRTGYKLGRWCDVIWLQLALGEHAPDPGEPIPFRDLPAQDISRILEQ